MLNTAKSMIDYQYSKNSQLAQDNRDWQERLANSAHQREIADLKKAGLNPVLSVTGGSGANTPSGASASVSDGAGYVNALVNLETAKINSATQMYMHDNLGANSIPGAVKYVLELITGRSDDELLGAGGAVLGLNNGFLGEYGYNSAFDWYRDFNPGGYQRMTQATSGLRDIVGGYLKFLSNKHSDLLSNGQYKKAERVAALYDKYAFLFPRAHYEASGYNHSPKASIQGKQPFRNLLKQDKERSKSYEKMRNRYNRYKKDSQYDNTYNNYKYNGKGYYYSPYKDSKGFSRPIRFNN